MTREEAIDRLKEARVGHKEFLSVEALDMAIKALEQEPYEKFKNAKDHIYKLAGDYKCWDNRLTEDEALELCHILEQESCEDAISRQLLLDIIKEQERLASDRVRDTPSSLSNKLYTWVNPEYTRYSAQLSERSQFKTMIQSMPPVAPQPKIGRWIAQDIHNCRTDFKCSECGYVHSFMHLYGEPTADYTYCPNCSAKME